LTLIVLNKGPPVFKGKVGDVMVKVNDTGKIKFPQIADPDPDDMFFVISCEFGLASDFITGKFPNFKVSPTNNAT
jgi:hypothetical protein